MKQWIATQITRLRLAVGRRILPHGVVPAYEVPLTVAAHDLAATAQYIRRSGHLQTVAGRNPQAVKRVNQSLATVADALRFGVLWSDG